MFLVIIDDPVDLDELEQSLVIFDDIDQLGDKPMKALLILYYYDRLFHTSNHMLIDLDGNVWSFGCNTCGQLGLSHYKNIKVPTQIPSIKEINQISRGGSSYHILLKNSQNEILVTGNNEFGHFTLGTDHKQVATPVEIDTNFSTI